MGIKRNEYCQPIFVCRKCGKETAILTYEENRLYMISCECGYTSKFIRDSEAEAVQSCNVLLALQECNDLKGERID